MPVGCRWALPPCVSCAGCGQQQGHLDPGRARHFSAPAQSYKLQLVEVAAVQQMVTAYQMLDEINKNGFIALYIHSPQARPI